MYKAIILTVGLGCLTLGCQNPEKSSVDQVINDEKPATNNNVDEQNNDDSNMSKSSEPELTSEQQMESNDSNTGKEERTADISSAGITGKDIIQSTAKKIAGRLNLDEQQTKSMLDILKLKYLETGAQLSSSYTDEESKDVGKQLRINAHEEIMSILNDDQKLILEKSMSK